jgi:hypothetical protein
MLIVLVEVVVIVPAVLVNLRTLIGNPKTKFAQNLQRYQY